MAEKWSHQYEVKQIKKYNEGLLPGEDKLQFEIKNKTLFTNNKKHAQQVLPPRPLDIFPKQQEQEYLDQIELAITMPKTQDGSQFVGLAAKIQDVQEARRAYKKVRQMYPSFDHVMMAYKVNKFAGYQDDGEHNAGMRIHARIMERGLHGLVVFVVRNFGGRHLGPQ